MSIFSAMRSAAWMGAAALIAANSSVVTAQSLATGNESARIGQGEVRNGLFLQGNETYRVVDTAGFRTAADVDSPEPGTVQPVGFHGSCLSCGTHGCRGGCGTASACGSSGCGPCGSGGYGYSSAFANPCAPCDPFCYVSAEALYMDNDTINGFTLSPHFIFGDFDHELGGRITVGSAPDCVHGYEFSFTGPLEWDRSASITAAGLGVPALITGLVPNLVDVVSGDLLINDLTGFADYAVVQNPITNVFSIDNTATATFQRQAFEAEYWSIETNRTMFAGEYAKLLIGGRYISYDELFVFNSITPTATGNLVSSTQNDLYGLQIGMDLLYPVCCHGYADFRTRFGGFVNDAQNQFAVVNDPGVANLVVTNANDDLGLAGLIELGAGIRYQIGEILSIRAGTELWYLTEIASANGQSTNVLRPTTGRATRASDDVLMTGVSVGAELRY